MAGHDELCAKADVGSLCNCECAGRQHAIANTKGGVPGAGSIGKKARAAAARDGKAAVVNNRAVPKDGAKVAKDAPAAVKTAAKKADADDNGPGAQYGRYIGEKRKAAEQQLSQVVADNEKWQRDTIADLKAKNPGKTDAQIIAMGRRDPQMKTRLARQQEAVKAAKEVFLDEDVNKIITKAQGRGKPAAAGKAGRADTLNEAIGKRQAAKADAAFGDRPRLDKSSATLGLRVEHADGKKGTIDDLSQRHTGRAKVKWDDGSTSAPMLDDLAADPKGGRMRVQAGQVRDGMRVEHPQWGAGTVKGDQGRNGGPLSVEFDKAPMGGSNRRIVNHATDLYPAGPKEPGRNASIGGSAAEGRANAAFGTQPRMTKADAAEGTRVMHLDNGTGEIVDNKGRHSGTVKVKFDNGGTDTVTLDDMVKAKPGQRAMSGPGGRAPDSSASGMRDAVQVTSRKRNGDAVSESVAMRDRMRQAALGSSQGRRARVEELKMTREQFDKLPADEQARALADLRRIKDSGDWRNAGRDSYGIAAKAPQRHVGEAGDLLRAFTAERRAAEPPKAGVVKRFDDAGERGAEDALRQMNRSELIELGEAKKWVTAEQAAKMKIGYLRKVLLNRSMGLDY